MARKGQAPDTNSDPATTTPEDTTTIEQQTGEGGAAADSQPPQAAIPGVTEPKPEAPAAAAEPPVRVVYDGVRFGERIDMTVSGETYVFFAGVAVTSPAGVAQLLVDAKKGITLAPRDQ